MNFVTDFIDNISEDMERERKLHMINRALNSAYKTGRNLELLELRLKAAKEAPSSKMLDEWIDGLELAEGKDHDKRWALLKERLKTIFGKAQLEDEFEEALENFNPADTMVSKAEVRREISLLKSYIGGDD